METNVEMGQKVKGILEKTIDAIKGFDTASENAKEISLKNYFSKKSLQRKLFSDELKLEISVNHQENVDVSGSLTGDLHRVWMDIKSFMATDNDLAMLEESIRGEKAALEEFGEVLSKEYLTLNLRNILSKQEVIIQTDLQTIKNMDDIKELYS